MVVRFNRPTGTEVSAMLHKGFILGGGGEGMLNKGAATREVRVGVAQACIAYYATLGANYCMANIAGILQDHLQLLSHPKIISTPQDG